MAAVRKAWLIRAGHGAEHVEQFVTGGFASIGWARIPGLEDLRNRDEEEILALLIAAERGQPTEDLRELVAFRTGISRGDLVVTVDTPARDLVFGDVISDYEFRPTPVVGDHRHVRRVRWFARWSRDLVEDAVGPETRHYQRTVLELPNQAEWLQLADRVRDDGAASVAVVDCA